MRDDIDISQYICGVLVEDPDGEHEEHGCTLPKGHHPEDMHCCPDEVAR